MCVCVVSYPDYFLHTEGENSLVSCLFNFCSNHHVRGAPIRLLHANDVMSIRLSQGYLRLTEASCFVNLRFLAFGSSEKDDPCNELSL